MKKRSNILTLLIICSTVLILNNCKKQGSESEDYRDQVKGNYTGIMIHGYIPDRIIQYDTFNITMILKKAITDSVIDLKFNPQLIKDYSFIYRKGGFISTTTYRPPTLKLSNDTLYFYVHPGAGPDWNDCICVKKTL